MKAAVITIGDEILNGTTIDSNSAFIGKALNTIGIDMHEKISISDNKIHILEILENYTKRFPIVLITGGLGPTRDDITKHTLIEFFKTEYVLNEKVLSFIENRFAKRGLTLTEKNREQAMVPANCTVIENTMGTAPGMWFTTEIGIAVSMPGVPYEMQEMMMRSIIPMLQNTFQLPAIYNRHIMTSGIGESWIAEKIEDIEFSLPPHIGLAYLPSPGIVKLRLTARGENYNAIKNETEIFSEKITERLGLYVYGFDNITLEEAIGKKLIQLQATLGTAESCTGGTVAQKIISVPGSSKYYNGSVIAYHNDIKTSLLHVAPETIATFGAVSEETISEMLISAKQVLQTDYIIATSGIAGPAGGTDEKPVGTVFIGISGKSDSVIKKFLFANNRAINIEYTAMFALHHLRIMLDTHLEKQG